MGRTPKSFQDTLEILRTIDSMPDARIEKCRVLYNLAKEAKDGCIVELGTYHGIGAIALYFGAQEGNGVDVFTIDDYESKRGWAGEVYAPDDQYVFYDNIKKTRSHPIFLKSDFEWLASTWYLHIALLFWDAGMPHPAMLSHIQQWFPMVIRGGIIYMHDTFGNLLGSRDVLKKMKDKIEIVGDDPGFCIVRKI